MDRYPGMTLPRRVLPAQTYLVTRRCIGRRFLLRPDDGLNNVFVYCLGLAATKYGVRIGETKAVLGAPQFDITSGTA